jgi:hypothetical protein
MISVLRDLEEQVTSLANMHAIEGCIHTYIHTYIHACIQYIIMHASIDGPCTLWSRHWSHTGEKEQARLKELGA